MTETLERQLVHLSAGAHICPIYTTTEEQMGVLVPFLQAGLTRGERCLYIADATSIDTVVQLLRGEGIDTQAEIDRGALLLVADRAPFFRGGRFDPHAMYTLLHGAATNARVSGFAGVSIAGEMTWIVGPDVADMRYLQCEAWLNQFPPQLATKIICQYDRRQFPPPILHDVLRVHPLVIVGEHVHENAYFDPYALVPDTPDAAEARVDSMLEQLQARTRRQTAIAELGRLSMSGARPADLMAVAVNLVASELHVEFAEVQELEPLDGTVRLTADVGWQPLTPGASEATDVDPSMLRVLDSGLPVIVPDWRVEDRFLPPPHLQSARIVSSLQVAIRTRADEPLEGVLGVHSASQRTFSEDEVVLLDTIAIQLAHASRARRAEEQFRALVDNSSDIVARLDHGLRHVYVNPAIESGLGVAAETILGKTIYEIGLPDALTRTWELILRRTLRTGREHTTEFSLTTWRGERHFRTQALAELAADGSVAFVLTVWRDVTEQRQAETERSEVYRELRDGQQRLVDMLSDRTGERERELQRVVDVVRSARLTDLERNVLQLVAQGWTNREIGARLGRTPGTVKNHVAAILSKLDVTDRTQAAARAVELGIVSRTPLETPGDPAPIR